MVPRAVVCSSNKKIVHKEVVCIMDRETNHTFVVQK
jgi:hypothetical protein